MIEMNGEHREDEYQESEIEHTAYVILCYAKLPQVLTQFDLAVNTWNPLERSLPSQHDYFYTVIRQLKTKMVNV